MSNMNEYLNLKKWCERHYANTNIKVFPQTVPLQTIIDELLGRLETAEAALAIACAKVAADTDRICQLESRVTLAEKRIEQKRRVTVKK